MDFYKITGEQPLYGKVHTEGAKNAVLPEIAAAILTSEPVSLKNVPELSDVRNMSKAAEIVGIEVRCSDGALILDASGVVPNAIPYESACKLRTSFLFAGPLLARCGTMKISMPGGCNIGNRPIDLHIKGFEKMGAVVSCDSGFIEAHAEGGLVGTEIYLDFPSVGATENLMMAACLARGTTVILNAAQEPEIRDLAALLCKMGGHVFIDEGERIVIEGVSRMNGCTHRVMPDRIEAGTYMIAAAATGGDVLIEGIDAQLLHPICAKLTESGVTVLEMPGCIRVKAGGSARAVDIKTLPYPGFPTDLQAQMTAFLTTAQGTGIVTETVFENRFNHICELCRMGAGIRLEGRSAIVDGGKMLTGTTVTAKDLRAGAALIIAALCAKGETFVFGLEHIDRGYSNIQKKLEILGGKVERCHDTSDQVETCSQ